MLNQKLVQQLLPQQTARRQYYMTKWHLRSKRKPSGGKLKRLRKKRKFEKGSGFLETRIDERRAKIKRATGGSRKTKLLSMDRVNITDTKTGKNIPTKILSVEENQANPHYVRRNIITKNAVIKTEAGLARVTSRPGQDGIINAVLIEKKKEKQ
jgi:small subunit ribosomal protein S8e